MHAPVGMQRVPNQLFERESGRDLKFGSYLGWECRKE